MHPENDSGSASAAGAGEVTRLLRRWGAGGADAAVEERLLELVYGELRRMATRELRRERGDHTLQPTALVHEAYLRLAAAEVPWADRSHFLAVAARAMRRILVDHARRQKAARRPDPRDRDAVDVAAAAGASPAYEEVIAVHLALERLADLDPRQAQVVELRYFGGLTVEETAAALGVSVPTVVRQQRAARAWLAVELDGR